MATNLLNINRQFNTQVLKHLNEKLTNNYKLLVIASNDSGRGDSEDVNNYNKSSLDYITNSTLCFIREITNPKIAIPATEAPQAVGDDLNYDAVAYKVKDLNTVNTDTHSFNHLYLEAVLVGEYDIFPDTGNDYTEGVISYNTTTVILTNISTAGNSVGYSYDYTKKNNNSNLPNLTESGKEVIILAQSRHKNIALAKADNNGYPPVDAEKTLYLMLKV